MLISCVKSDLVVLTDWLIQVGSLVIATEKHHVVVFNPAYRRRSILSFLIVVSSVTLPIWTITTAFLRSKLTRIKFKSAQDKVTHRAVITRTFEKDGRGRFQAKQTWHECLFHEDDDGDCVKDCSLTFHVQACVSFAQSDQTLKHSNWLAIFTDFRVLPKELVVSV